MKLVVTRQYFSATTTIGTLMIDGTFEAYTLEPKSRGLVATMTVQDIETIKVPGKTAIPLGTYKVSKYYSPEHGMEVPILQSVPGFGDVEIHAGNFAADTKACLLLGTAKGTDEVLHSQDAIGRFYPKVFGALANGEPVTITYR